MQAGRIYFQFFAVGCFQISAIEKAEFPYIMQEVLGEKHGLYRLKYVSPIKLTFFFWTFPARLSIFSYFAFYIFFTAMKRNDLLWKATLEDLFDDFLRFFYPDADELFDLSRGFEYLDKELDQLFPPEADLYEPRYIDKLVKVFTKAGDEEWILIHIEVQSYTDKDFAKRMFQYYYRILDKYDKPITAFAIFAYSKKIS